jgi:hypothetical protein
MTHDTAATTICPCRMVVIVTNLGLPREMKDPIFNWSCGRLDRCPDCEFWPSDLLTFWQTVSSIKKIEQNIFGRHHCYKGDHNTPTARYSTGSDVMMLGSDCFRENLLMCALLLTLRWCGSCWYNVLRVSYLVRLCTSTGWYLEYL